MSDDCNYFKRWVIAAKCFGMAPINYTKTQRLKKYLFVIYIIFLMSLYSISGAVCLIHSVLYGPKVNVSYGVMHVLQFINVTFSLNICLLQTIMKKAQWNVLLSYLQCKNLKKNPIREVKNNIYMKLCIIVLPILLTIREVQVDSQVKSNIHYFWYIISRLGTLNHFFWSLFISTTMLLIADQYKSFNRYLKIIPLQVSTLMGKEHNGNLNEVRKLYTAVYGIVNQINIIFGWQIFFIFTTAVIGIMIYLNCIVTLASMKTLEILDSGLKEVLNTTIEVINIVVLVMSCDKVEQNAKEFTVTCDLLQGNMDKSPLRDELHYLSQYVRKLKPKCSAAGFFSVNQMILGALFSSIISYLIVSIQFNISLENKY